MKINEVRAADGRE